MSSSIPKNSLELAINHFLNNMQCPRPRYVTAGKFGKKANTLVPWTQNYKLVETALDSLLPNPKDETNINSILHLALKTNKEPSTFVLYSDGNADWPLSPAHAKKLAEKTAKQIRAQYSKVICFLLGPKANIKVMNTICGGPENVYAMTAPDKPSLCNKY